MRLASSVVLAAVLVGCSENPTEPQPVDLASVTVVRQSQVSENGAEVLNRGSKDISAYRCFRGGLLTNDLTINHRPNGGATLSCQWKDLPPVQKAFTNRDFPCSLSFDGVFKFTYESRFTRTPAGVATMTCQFPADS